MPATEAAPVPEAERRRADAPLPSRPPPSLQIVRRGDSTPPHAIDDEMHDDENVEAPPGPTVFVTDPTVEAARIEWAMRARGYVVIDVPLAMLVGRAAVQRPHLILLDIDAPGALDVAARVRSLEGGAGIHLIYAGHAGQTFVDARDALAHEGSGFFARPIDIDALVGKIDTLLGLDEPPHVEGVAQANDHGAPSATRPPSNPPNSGRPPIRRSSRPPPPSLRAPASPLPPPPNRPLPPPPEGPISLMPPSTHGRADTSEGAPLDAAASSDRRGWTAKAAEARLSPDLERLLREAEARVIGPGSQRHPESGLPIEDEVLSPEDEVEAVLPAEILASLDDPLDLGVEDDDGSNADTGSPRQGTTGRGVRVRGSTGGSTQGGTQAATTAAPMLSGTNLGTQAGTNVGTGGAPLEGEAGVLTTSGGAAAREASLQEASPMPPLVDVRATGRHGAIDAMSMHAAFTDPHDAAAVSRNADTPRPPGRPPLGEPRALTSPAHVDAGPDDDDDERSQSQISQQMAMPRPASEHPPPLAPITARPPRMQQLQDVARIPPAPPPQLVELPPPPTPNPPPVAYVPPPLPAARAILSADESLRAFAEAVASRVTGVLRVDEVAGIRRIVLQDGDVVTAASSVEGESLLGYLQGRGDLPAEVVKRLEGRVPPFGRLAGAALVAHGHLHQEQLWDVLQAHAAWLLTRAVGIVRGQLAFENEAPQRLRGEPPVFGGTPGPALVVEITRRAVPPAEAIGRLGGLDVRFSGGARGRLIDECGLDEADDVVVRRAAGASLREVIAARGEEIAPLMYALVALGILGSLSAARAPHAKVGAAAEVEVEAIDPLRDAEIDDAAIRSRIGVRRALVEDGDYFAILGVPRVATGYEIRRAYVELRRSLEPSRVLRASLLDLAEELQLVLQVLDEAYDVLKDPTRRDRYRRAISHEPPS